MLRKRNLLLILCAIAQYSWGKGFKYLFEKAQIKNDQIAIQKLEFESQLLSLNLVESALTPRFSSYLTYSDTKPVSLYSFQSQQTLLWAAGLEISSQFRWGGALSFKHDFIDYDLSRWSTSSVSNLGTQRPVEVSNTLIYKQDLWKNFFGKNYRLKLTETRAQIDSEEIKLTWEQHRFYSQLFESYLTGIKEYSHFVLAKQTLERAKRRLNYIKKRYRDGLSLKVDYLKAQSDYIEQELVLDRGRFALKRSLDKLSNYIQESLDENSLLLIDLNTYQEIPWPEPIKTDSESLSLDYQAIKKRLEAIQIFERRKQLDKRSELNLSLTYKMSELGDTYSKSLEEAQLGSDRYEKAIQLTWSVPFGESPQSVDALRSKINSKKSRIQLKQLKDHLMRSNKTLALQINSERKLADQLKKKIRLTQGVLEAQSKRYRRGKIDLEQVLIAEEQYSLAIKTYIDYFYQHYLHCAQLALQTNQFDLFLKGTAFKL